MYTDEDIARVVHQANGALQAIQGDSCPSAPWDAVTAELRAGTIEGVRRARSGETPRELHESWADRKRDLGWIHGPVKDEERKTHPCLVPYDDLPAGQRDKDALFFHIVLLMASLSAQS
jgi:hypothetical protein